MAEPESSSPTEAHEAFHLPPPSILPPVLALGIAFTLTGLIVTPILLVVGIVLDVGAVGLWVRDARREFVKLPE